MTTAQRDAIRRHGEQLQAIFPAVAHLDPVSLCKKLRRLERKGEQIGVDMCCRQPTHDDEYEERGERLIAKLDELLRFSEVEAPVFLNRDPRGYALKIEPEWTRENNIDIHRDMGGYGILAPEIN